jgi:carbon starvation protein CstA
VAVGGCSIVASAAANAAEFVPRSDAVNNPVATNGAACSFMDANASWLYSRIDSMAFSKFFCLLFRLLLVVVPVTAGVRRGDQAQQDRAKHNSRAARKERTIMTILVASDSNKETKTSNIIPIDVTVTPLFLLWRSQCSKSKSSRRENRSMSAFD